MTKKEMSVSGNRKRTLLTCHVRRRCSDTTSLYLQRCETRFCSTSHQEVDLLIMDPFVDDGPERENNREHVRYQSDHQTNGGQGKNCSYDSSHNIHTGVPFARTHWHSCSSGLNPV